MDENDSKVHSQCRPEELDGLRRPDAPDEPLAQLDEGGPVALDGADDDHDEVGVGEHLGGVADAVVHLLGAVHLLHGRARNLHRKELEHLVADVEGQVEHHVPCKGGRGVVKWIIGFCFRLPAHEQGKR